MGYEPLFQIGQTVQIVHGEMMTLEDVRHIGKLGIVRDILVPNSDPEIYQVEFENDINEYWFGWDDLIAVPIISPADTAPVSPPLDSIHNDGHTHAVSDPDTRAEMGQALAAWSQAENAAPEALDDDMMTDEEIIAYVRKITELENLLEPQWVLNIIEKRDAELASLRARVAELEAALKRIAENGREHQPSREEYNYDEFRYGYALGKYHQSEEARKVLAEED